MLSLDPSRPQRVFVTGTGTGVGKTLVSAILAAAWNADYWKPVQAGLRPPTDPDWVAIARGGEGGKVYAPRYSLSMPASPHIAARAEGICITREALLQALPVEADRLVIEGAGGLMVPLDQDFFVADLPRLFDARVILVSRNELGSINHSLLTAMACRVRKLPVLGWIFTGTYLSYEEEIVHWSGYPRLASIPQVPDPGPAFVQEQAARLRPLSIFSHE